MHDQPGKILHSNHVIHLNVLSFTTNKMKCLFETSIEICALNAHLNTISWTQVMLCGCGMGNHAFGSSHLVGEPPDIEIKTI